MIYIYAIAALIIASIYFYCCYPYKVISNHDGDTSWIKPIIGKQEKVRFAVVDANEDSNNMKQAGGKEATEYLNKIMPVGSRIFIVIRGKSESYGRKSVTLYRLWTDINLKMLRAGHAVIDPRYLKDIPPSMQKQYTKAQEHAKYWKRGRWGNPKHCALNPWEFRANCKRKN